ncbi:hypothetical protein DTL42_02530 [Bremerella cremea]|uniref:ASPIC/UnbV domain-containing protein n=1 Tax=Bremerella cremea TaxID=1031537 RepID=A0A368KUJ6_9BACT|nr:FG-GAP-like repeat-containing protein [Bremerella cremea]RCS54049.1 hypothetical protein DTL42_02530 [Bremerella cremea]
MQLSWKLLLSVGAALLVLVALVFLNWRTAKIEQETTQLRELLSAKNVALGYLEADQPDKTFTAWSQLAEAFPDEPLGPQNQVVAYLMAIQNAGGPPSTEALQQLSLAIERLKEIAPNSATTYSLLARADKAHGETPAALKAWQRAGELDPTNAAIWFEAYLTAKEAGPEQTNASEELLAKAAQLAPDNLAVLLEQLPSLAQQQSPQIVAVLDRAEKVFAPLEASVQRLVNVSLADMIAKTREAAQQGDWPSVRRSVQMMRNATRAEEAVQSDRLIVERSPLEFVVTDFSPQFYLAHAGELTTPEPPIDVKFAAGQQTKLGEATNTRDLVLVDVDRNDTLDLVVLTNDALLVFLQEKNSEGYSPPIRIPIAGDFTNILAADLDGDSEITDGEVRQTADIDFILYGPSGIAVVENQQANPLTLAIVEQESAVPEVQTAVLADLDHDGDLDLFLGTPGKPMVWSNVDGLHFKPWADDAISGMENSGPMVQAIAVDWDRDTDIDILVAYEGAPGFGIFENLRHRRMRWCSLNEDFPGIDRATVFDIVDIDSNASWDILFADSNSLNLARTRTVEAGKVVPLDTTRIAAGKFPKHWRILDYDNDGREDLLAYEDAQLQLLRGTADGKLVPTKGVLSAQEANIVAARTADLDQDGDLDLVLLLPEAILPVFNEGGNQNNWINVRLLAAQVKGGAASPSGRVNQYGLGSLLELRSDISYQAQVVRAETTHFGLGKRTQADALRVIWTNGIPQSILQPKVNTLITERQTLKGSCPYLYAWNGDRFEFVTDLLWAAPIGLQTAEGQIAPDRPWEYIKVPGHLLAEANGQYKLRITEELWEAAYFDQVELFAVDHPAEVEVYTNEKVGPPSIAEPKLHVVGQKIAPTIALDSQGRDVLDLLAKQDDQYVKGFERKFLQGVTEPHYIELLFDLPQDASQITLFLTGWIYPADTSINVGLAENQAMPGPRPPFLETLDNEGKWVETIPFTGFPGGKTKTIAIDISHAFAGDSRRLRVVTSNEIYWDEAFVTVVTPAVEVRETLLNLRTAELAYRGFSEPIVHPGFGPERYDYENVSTLPKWSAMSGQFTRYGDVLPLLQKVDDQLVVMGSGDEMALTFDIPAQPLPPGWKRDFVLHSVGWDKDADLNTIYGTSSEPLPYQNMGSYPAQSYRDDSAYRDYLEAYQTRQQQSARFRNQWLAP